MKKMRQRQNLEFAMHTSEPAEKVFPLLCPVREYDWIPHWRCEMDYSSSGIAELGCVFTTDFKDIFGKETWVVSTYEPNRKIGFVRTGEMRTTRYTISLEQKEKGTSLLWQQEMTALNPESDELIAKHASDYFHNQMVQLEKLLNHFLIHGTIYAGELSA